MTKHISSFIAFSLGTITPPHFHWVITAASKDMVPQDPPDAVPKCKSLVTFSRPSDACISSLTFRTMTGNTIEAPTVMAMTHPWTVEELRT